MVEQKGNVEEVEADEPVWVTDLEDGIRGPDGPNVLLSALSRLNGLDVIVDNAMDAGLSPEDYNTALVFSSAIKRAQEVLLMYSKHILNHYVLFVILFAGGFGIWRIQMQVSFLV